jgi:hypothetical protein
MSGCTRGLCVEWDAETYASTGTPTTADAGFGIRDSGFGNRDSGFGIRDPNPEPRTPNPEPRTPTNQPSALRLGAALRSERCMLNAVLTSATWENACGKLPT